jgi:hypothetical protein
MINLAVGLSRGYSRRVRMSLLEAMRVESSFRNLNYGDRDSQGVLQQRPSTGWGPPGNARRDIKQYLSRASQVDRGFKGTAGQLAQAVQRSAFPERYDQHKAEAARLLGTMPGIAGGGGGGPQVVGTLGGGGVGGRAAFATALMSRVSGAQDAPSVLDLVQLLQQPAGPGGGGRGGAGSMGGAGATFTPGGGWGGSKGVAADVIAGHGLSVTSTKRERKHTTTGGVSDHWTGSRNSYAYDLGGSVAAMDRAAVRIARRLGIRYQKGRPLVATVRRGGYRIQVLYRTQTGGNHFNHIHVGVARA